MPVLISSLVSIGMLPGILTEGLRLAYIAFDSVPAPKGASTHIAAFTRALARRFGRIHLVTPGQTADTIERWPGVFHTELPAQGVSLVDRILCFQAYLQ